MYTYKIFRDEMFYWMAKFRYRYYDGLNNFSLAFVFVMEKILCSTKENMTNEKRK